MKNNFKKILTTSIVSAVSLTAIGCSTTNTKLAKNIDKSMAEFVTSINKLDYVDTSTTDNKLGKIVETTSNDNSYIKTLNNLNIENTITRPSERNDNFKLFVLSSKPFITFTSDDNSTSLQLSVKFSTDKIEETSDEISSKINQLILKRSILMIYVNEIYNGNVSLSEENKVAINAYTNVIKENTSFLNGNRGMVKNQLSLANDLVTSDNNDNLINYYIIKSGEALETRSNKIDSTISAIDSIISILETNLSPSSTYYQSKLSATYENILNGMNTSDSSDENKELAKKIADSLNFCLQTNNNNSENNQNQTNEDTTQSNLTKDIKDNSYYAKEKTKINNNISNNQDNNKNNNIRTLENNENITSNRRTRRFRNRNNGTIISTDNNSKSNSAKSVTKMDNENQNNTVRATRTPSKPSNEEYISSNPSENNTIINHATRTPHRF